MFRPLRSKRKTDGQLLRAELGESVDHALRAAGHAAGGVKAAVEPRLSRVRSTSGAKLAPAKERVRGTAAKLKRTRSEEKVSSRWPKFAGLLVMGALVGAAAAFVLRRRRQQQWEEYDPMEAVKEERKAEPATGPAQQPAEAPEPSRRP